MTRFSAPRCAKHGCEMAWGRVPPGKEGYVCELCEEETRRAFRSAMEMDRALFDPSLQKLLADHKRGSS